MLPDHEQNYRTFLGSILTLITWITLGMYICYKFLILWNIEEYSLQEAFVEDYFESDETFTSENGFMIAAAVTSYDGKSDDIEDETIGTIKMYYKQWDVYDEENGGLRFTQIPLRPCLPSDFNTVDGSNEASKFYPTEKNSEKNL